MSAQRYGQCLGIYDCGFFANASALVDSTVAAIGSRNDDRSRDSR